MVKTTLPAWYFPTTVIFIDDNTKFLKKLLFNIDRKKIVPKFINDSLKASQFLKTLPQEDLISRVLASIELKDHEELYTNIDKTLLLLEENLTKIDRFNEVSLIVVDYAMPGFNGLEICSQLRTINNSIKILMLTGEASTHLAVKAFNEGLIDKFMRKDDPDFLSKLSREIETLQKAYFQEISKMVLNRLNMDPKDPIATCLQDSAFVSLFEDICQEKGIVEYHLFNSDGSFILFDFSGNPTLLAVKDEHMMEDAYEVALNATEPFPPQLLSAMKNYQEILCLYGDNLCDDPYSAKRFLHPATKLIGEKTYYYSLIEDIKAYPLNTQKRVSFEEHTNKIKTSANFFIDI
jgi:CheY-like chemotaxis protein